MKTRAQIIEFNNKYNQEKNQILTLINALAMKMQEDSKTEDENDFMTDHTVNMETNKFEISFTFRDVRY